MVVCLYDCGGVSDTLLNILNTNISAQDALSAEFMISHRTVYMLVFNLLEPEEEKSKLEYYLHTIHKNVKYPVVIMLIGK